MSQILTLELDDQVFAAIQRQAENIGILPENLAATLLEEKFSHTFRIMLTDTDKVSGREKFERHFGAIDFNCATDLDNEIIDADLVKEYTSTHEEE